MSSAVGSAAPGLVLAAALVCRVAFRPREAATNGGSLCSFCQGPAQVAADLGLHWSPF